MDMSNSDTLTQARVDELSWLEVENLFKLKSEELPLPTEMNRMLSSEESTMIGGEVELVVDEVRHGLLDYLHVVILTDKEQNWCLPIWTDRTQAHTTENLIHNTALPNSYHLLCKIVEGFSSVVSMAIVSPLNKWRAKLIFASGDRRFGVECVSSDAVITALIAKAPIYAMKSELDTEGIPRAEADKDLYEKGFI